LSKVIDAHQHFWKIDGQEQSWRTSAHAAIDKDYLPSSLEKDLNACEISGTVLMQSVDSEEENDRLFDFAHEASFVKGVVAWLPLNDGVAAKKELTRISKGQNLCGVRTLIAKDDLHWLTSNTSVELFKEISKMNLAWDVVPITDSQIAAVKKLAKLVPDLHIIIDHMGRPPVDSREWQPWAKNIEELSENSNVAIKISVGIDVLTAWSEWNKNELEKYIHHVLRNFGPDRSLLASNWPVVLLRNTYENSWRDLVELITSFGLSSQDLSKVMGGSATEWYGLS
jgi:L-fuconolactonase